MLNALSLWQTVKQTWTQACRVCNGVFSESCIRGNAFFRMVYCWVPAYILLCIMLPPHLQCTLDTSLHAFTVCYFCWTLHVSAVIILIAKLLRLQCLVGACACYGLSLYTPSMASVMFIQSNPRACIGCSSPHFAVSLFHSTILFHRIKTPYFLVYSSFCW